MPEYDIFISYASEEREWVRQNLYEPLLRCRNANGRPPRIFFDVGEQGIKVGEDFLSSLVHAIIASDYVVPVYSRIYFDKRFCNWELGRSLEFSISKGRPELTPILKEAAASSSVPLSVSNIERLSVETPDWFRRLCKKFGLSDTGERLVLEFIDQMPSEVRVNHTLPPVRVRVSRTVGELGAEQEVTLCAEPDDVGGTLSVRTEKGVASFNDLSVGSAVPALQLIASANGCESVRSAAFSVVTPPPGPASCETGLPLVPARGEAIFFATGSALAVLEDDGISVFDLQGAPLGVKLPLEARPRLLSRAGPMLVLVDWGGNLTVLREDGAGHQWPFDSDASGLCVPGCVALDGEETYIGFWSGALYRVPFLGEPVHLRTHAAGIQALAIGVDRTCIAGLDGTLAIFDRSGATQTYSLEPIIHLLKLYPGRLVAVGDSRLYQLRLASGTLYDERLPFTGVSAVLSESDLPVVLNAQGRGLRFDAELVARVRFHARAGARPISSDDDEHNCLFRNSDGSHALMVGDQFVFTHLGGTMAVAPNGAHVALGDESGIQILDRTQFQALLQEAAHV